MYSRILQGIGHLRFQNEGRVEQNRDKREDEETKENIVSNIRWPKAESDSQVAPPWLGCCHEKSRNGGVLKFEFSSSIGYAASFQSFGS